MELTNKYSIDQKQRRAKYSKTTVRHHYLKYFARGIKLRILQISKISTSQNFRGTKEFSFSFSDEDFYNI